MNSSCSLHCSRRSEVVKKCGERGGKVGHYTAFRYESVDGRGRWASLEIYGAPAINSFRRWKLNRGGSERLHVILAKRKKNTCTNRLRLLRKPWDVSTQDQNKKKKKKVSLKESFCVRWQVFVSSLNPSSVFAPSREMGNFFGANGVCLFFFFSATFLRVIPLWWSIKQTGAHQWYWLRCMVSRYSSSHQSPALNGISFRTLKGVLTVLEVRFYRERRPKTKSAFWNEKPKNLSCVLCLLALISFRLSSSFLLSLR